MALIRPIPSSANTYKLQYTGTFTASVSTGSAAGQATITINTGITGLSEYYLGINNIAFDNSSSDTRTTLYRGSITSVSYNSSTGDITITAQSAFVQNATITCTGTVYLFGK
jgi:hypothetical protein